MKITFCAYDSPNHIGGPNTVLRRLLPPLREYGVDPSALVLQTGAPGRGRTAQALLRSGIRTVQTRRPSSTEATLRWIGAALAANPPDAFAPDYVAPAYFATPWLRAAGITTVGTIHGNDAFYDALIDEFVAGEPAHQLD